jgi:CHAT domain-containing protein/tetratricopeptide (TPR) repeat protein
MGVSPALTTLAATLIVAGISAQDEREPTSRCAVVRVVREGTATRPTTAVPVTIPSAGFLAAWVETVVGDVDLFLELRNGSGAITASDDDGAGGTRPCVWFDAKAADVASLTVIAKEGDAAEATLRIVFHPTTAEAAALAERCAPEAAFARENSKGGRSRPTDAVRRALRELLEHPATKRDRKLLLLSGEIIDGGFDWSAPADAELRVRAAELGVEGIPAMVPPAHQMAVNARRRLGLALENAGRRKEAQAEFDRMIAAAEEHRRRNPMYLGTALLALGNCLHNQERLREAAEAYQRAEDPLAASTHPKGPELLHFARLMAGACLIDSGRAKAAVPVLERGVAFAASRPSLGHDGVFDIRCSLARALDQSGDSEKALVVLREGLAWAAGVEGVPSKSKFAARCQILECAAKSGDIPSATAEMRRLREAGAADAPDDFVHLGASLLIFTNAVVFAGEPELAVNAIQEWIAAAAGTPCDAAWIACSLRAYGGVCAASIGDLELAQRWTAEAEAWPAGDPGDPLAKDARRLAKAARMMTTALVREAGRDAAASRGLPAGSPDAVWERRMRDMIEALDVVVGGLDGAESGPAGWRRIERAAEFARHLPLPQARQSADAMMTLLVMKIVGDGDLPEAVRRVDAQADKMRAGSSRDDHWVLQCLVSGLALRAELGTFDARFAADLTALIEGVEHRLQTTALRMSPRQSAASVAEARNAAALVMQFCGRTGDANFARTARSAAWRVVEGARAIGVETARLTRAAAAADPEAVLALRSEIARATAKLARLAGGAAKPDKFAKALEAKEVPERALRALLGSVSAAARPSFAMDAREERLTAALPASSAYVGYWRRVDLDCTPDGRKLGLIHPRYGAFVVRGDGSSEFVDLGPAEAIENAVDALRVAMSGGGSRGVDEPDVVAGGATAIGRRVREALLDPVVAAAGDVRRLVIACDGAAHLVPFDALPQGAGVVGDLLSVSTVTTLDDLLSQATSPASAALLTIGGVDYDAAIGEPAAAESTASSRADSRSRPSPPPDDLFLAGRRRALRDGGPRFDALPATRDEVDAVRDAVGEDVASTSLQGAAATKAGFAAAAPRARVLHVATHGFFAPDAVSALTVEGEGASPLTAGVRDMVSGFEPFLLAGLAFAGANKTDAATGRFDGVMTASEIAVLDLSACELATLSACDTGVGRRRAAGDLASLRLALHAAGARHALTSLWKVPDEATRRLMTEFYRRRFRDGESLHAALWNAKRTLRDARDPQSGAPLYGPRDWAGWVLTGPPD